MQTNSQQRTQHNTEQRFLRSTIASYTSLSLRLLINFGARWLLVRLVLDTGHGLYAQALTIVTIAAAIRDLGMVHHLMRDERKPYGTVLAFSASTGALLTLVLIVAAPAFSFLSPDLPQVLRVFAIWVLLDGLMVVPRTFFERELRMGKLLWPEILRGLTMAAISVGLAWNGWEIWSLVLGELAAALLFAVLVWWRAWGQVPLVLDWSILGDLLRRSRLLFGVWIVHQLVAKSDYLILGNFFEDSVVGQYDRAFWIVLLVGTIVGPRALLPALVEYRSDSERFLQAFRFGVVTLLSFQVMAAYFFFLNADKVVLLLLGDRWQTAVPLLQVLCFVPLLDISAEIGGQVLKVHNQDRVWLLALLINLVSLIVLGPLLVLRFGPIGMAWANFVPLGNALMVWRLWKILGPGFTAVLKDLLFVYLAPLPLFVAAGLLSQEDSWLRFGLCCVAAALAVAILAWRFYPSFRDFFSESGRREEASSSPTTERD